MDWELRIVHGSEFMDNLRFEKMEPLISQIARIRDTKGAEGLYLSSGCRKWGEQAGLPHNPAESGGFAGVFGGAGAFCGGIEKTQKYDDERLPMKKVSFVGCVNAYLSAVYD
ncbi:MAG TPA: hypothetical protein PKB02_11500 [Anaerohalosphaeraceae bacterium]|nr:hypothetical protein [Anaerohalosphaeraceae bacterium]